MLICQKQRNFRLIKTNGSPLYFSRINRYRLILSQKQNNSEGVFFQKKSSHMTHRNFSIFLYHSWNQTTVKGTTSVDIWIIVPQKTVQGKMVTFYSTPSSCSNKMYKHFSIREYSTSLLHTILICCVYPLSSNMFHKCLTSIKGKSCNNCFKGK